MSLNCQVIELQKDMRWANENFKVVFDRLDTLEKQNELLRKMIQQLITRG